MACSGNYGFHLVSVQVSPIASVAARISRLAGQTACKPASHTSQVLIVPALQSECALNESAQPALAPAQEDSSWVDLSANWKLTNVKLALTHITYDPWVLVPDIFLHAADAAQCQQQPDTLKCTENVIEWQQNVGSQQS